ncbi:hypothetical protein BDM02DRAFT_2318252 [Thelephora ganbajun]|uniref:Uncharacterized protein n=1 Tax=Thelephora ganbajun TaxID=370292 RepID=A0ACB6ZF59_THEGA|nr:hypothetical protein BDM02DRAFT_2318252 [Thelephora ganbajun]
MTQSTLSNLQDHLSLVSFQEFLGDRLVNLITVLTVEEVKINKCHHTAVCPVICNNGTFGWISYLDRGADLSPQDREEVEGWDHLQPGARPPKVLADLFEAVVGAVFLQHGSLRLDNWLRTIFGPTLGAATKDCWYSTTWTLAFYRDHQISTFSCAFHL